MLKDTFETQCPECGAVTRFEIGRVGARALRNARGLRALAAAADQSGLAIELRAVKAEGNGLGPGWWWVDIDAPSAGDILEVGELAGIELARGGGFVGPLPENPRFSFPAEGG